MQPFEYVYSFAPMRPPRVSVTTFTSYICCIYTLKFGQYWTLLCIGSSSVSSMPCMQFLFIRPRLCRGLPSDSTSRWTPLPLANSSYCQVCSGLSPPSDSACRAHYKKHRHGGGVFTRLGAQAVPSPPTEGSAQAFRPLIRTGYDLRKIKEKPPHGIHLFRLHGKVYIRMLFIPMMGAFIPDVVPDRSFTVT